MPPTGFKRSRALWDHALTRQHASKSQEAKSWLRAIAYELQPTRSSIEWKTEWGQQRVQGLLKWLLLETAPRILQRCYQFVSEMTLRHWMIVACVFGYYLFVRLAHETLQAGPLVLIVTALVLIFTVGLGDDDRKDELSAYSVFNRGFQQLLGTMDAEELAAQHVGGGMMMMMGGGGGGGGAIMRHQLPPPAEEVENDRPAAPLLMGAANDNNNNDDQQPVQAPPQQQAANGGGNRRVTGKKARRRRRDPEQRREMQRQRQAAAALGGNDDDDDAVAMQLLIEEQIIRNNNQ